jgi:hypothetical protein
MGCYLVVGANLFAHLPNRQIDRANKFAPTGFDLYRNQLGLNGKSVILAIKIQESFEGLAI